MFGLNIHFLSFKLSPNLYQKNDKIRVSATTYPEQNKDAFIVECQKMNYVHHFFTIRVTEKTERIIFVFRRKSFLHSDPIIASTIVYAKDFPSPNNSKNMEIKTMYIYEPVKSGNKNRKIFGEMQVQFSVAEASPTETTAINFGITRFHKAEGYAKVDINENQLYNNSIFGDFDMLN
ncbi:hypothetical protein M9Y10_007961 [Tritrichomonas musculus]|uniref:Uncharacterized protein n=1 Tax=Tritrichomonas musculus TaxID=1915356 RepID=A0ABR2J445_9EUKA